MFVALKIVHLLALGLGLGFAAVKAIIGMRMRSADAATAGEYRALQGVMGRIGAWSLLAIWVTGIAMLTMRYGGNMGALGGSFHAKMLFVVIFSVLTGYAMMISARARRAGQPADPKKMRMAGTLASIALVLAIVFAVITFG